MLTFEKVQQGNFELVYKIPKEVGQRYEELTSFYRGRDFNKEIESYIESFVNDFRSFVTPENEKALDERLVRYNKLVVELRTNILKATTIPSVMISGGANYPTRKKKRELDRIHELERELYSNDGKHERFLDNTRKMFDPVLIEQRENVDAKRKAKAKEEGWQAFYSELEHEEIAGYGIDLEDNRIYIVTNGKSSEDIRGLLKSAAMRWSPKNKRWQRILTENAIRAIENKILIPLELSE
ncbi:hypothetical protein AB1I60_08485 [Enterococcus entomosocium]|uniref:hypothetical protein n=1 Tax=Enterococcus entomosocium TaxID=3034352 RepID=UPI003459B0B0